MPDSVKWTERLVCDVLERKFAKSGNGGSGEYAFMRQVRNDAGFSASRTFDAMAVSLWPSRGFETHIFEIKVSKTDWRRELQDGAKAEAACEVADRFSIVAPYGVVDKAELPPTWGLIEVGGTASRATVAAPLLRKKGSRQSFPAGLVISMLRSAGAVPGRETPQEAALRAEFLRGRQEGVAQQDELAKRQRQDLDEMHEHIRRFQSASGINVVPSSYRTQEEVLAVAGQIKVALADEQHAERVRVRVRSMAAQLTSAADELRRLVADDG